MSLQRLCTQDTPLKVSFEFFPPRTPAMEEQRWGALRRLAPLAPTFVSVTYGAGGSTRDRTHATVRRILDETNLIPAAHLTCVAATRAEVDEVVRNYWNAGVRHIVALRGDMPEQGAPYRAHPGGYQSTPELVAGIRGIAPFEISVGAYPERHPDSGSLDDDIDMLKQKVEAGASRAIGQFAFDTEAIVRFRDRARARGVSVPLVPGLMPSTNFSGVMRMAGRCGTKISAWLARLYDGLDDDVESRKAIAAAVLAEQVEQLRLEGFEQFHFYTLNQADLTYAACRLLGLRERHADV